MSPNEPHTSLQARPLHVLVVDDDPIVLRVVEAALIGEGLHVETVYTAEEAMARIGEFDLVLSDDHLTGMRGRSFLQVVRQAGHVTPFVLMTSAPTIDGVIEAFERGATSFLTKPLRTAELLRVVRRAAAGAIEAPPASLLTPVPAPPIVGGPTAERRLHDALDRALDGLWVAFQPICCLSDSVVFGYEALMRSREPTLPHPGAVLEAAEALGRLPDVGRRMRQLSAAAFAGAAPDALLFVNLHPLDLIDDELGTSADPLAAFADRVVLEVTERSDLLLVPDGARRLERLRERGFRLAIDDLGAGYSGLTSLVDMDPEIVKLDMALVRDIDRDPRKRRVVGSLVRLCAELGRIVTAEGVERREELDVLRELGCDLVQGYFLARPGAAFPEVRWPQ